MSNISNETELSTFLSSLNDTNGLILNNIYLDSTFEFVSNGIKKLYSNGKNNLIKLNVNKTQGYMIDLTDILTLLSKFNTIDDYGANSTVQYISPVYPSLTKTIDNIPVINMTADTFLLFEFNLDEAWQSSHNLCVFTPYFYSTTDNTAEYTTFASVDTSLFFTKSSLDANNTIKICCTSSQYIGNIYTNLGYNISKIPIEYVNNSTYNVLIRFGTLGPRDSTPYINTYFKTSIHNMSTIDQPSYYTSSDIISSFPFVYTPVSNENTIVVINEFNSVVNGVSTLISNPESYILYPYLSNMVDPVINYAVQNFYDSINLKNLNPPRTPINVQANNTGENYLMSDAVPVSNLSDSYLFIICLNQYSSGAGITSNVQIYNNITHNEIENGIIITGPSLPQFISDNFPFPNSNTLPPYSLYIYSMPYLYANTNGTSILITERISYGQTNYNHIVYDSITTSKVFVGESSDINSLISTLQQEFSNLTIVTNGV